MQKGKVPIQIRMKADIQPYFPTLIISLALGYLRNLVRCKEIDGIMRVVPVVVVHRGDGFG